MTHDERVSELVRELDNAGLTTTVKTGGKITVRHPRDDFGTLKETVTLYQGDEGATFLQWSWGESLQVIDTQMVAIMVGRCVTPQVARA